MSTSVGSIHYDLALDKSRFDSGTAEVHTQLGGLSSKAAAVAKGIAVAFTAMGAAATGFAIKGAADFEQTRIGLENMLGSADAARKMLKDISKFAAETPFEFPELAQATRQLVAFGFSGEDAFKTMKQLGDVSAAIGAPIGDLSYLMGTLKAQGRAFMIDIRQFAQRGIPIYEYLAKVFKTNTQEVAKLIEAGKVGFPEVQKAFELMTAEGGKFHGTMAKQSKSLSGLFSTLKDNIGLAARELVGISQEGDVKAGSLFDRLRIATAGLNEQLSKIDWSRIAGSALAWAESTVAAVVSVGQAVMNFLGPSLKALWNTIETQLLPSLMKLWQQVIQPLLPVLGVALVGVLWAVINGFNVLLQIVTPVINFLANNTWIVYGLATAFIALKAAMMLNTAFSALSAGFTLLTAVQIPAVMAKLTALRALTAMQMTMGGVLVAGAIADIMLVKKAVDTVRQAISDMKAAAQSANDYEYAKNSTHQTLLDLSRNGSAEQKARANALLKKGFASGGFTGRGPATEPAGMVHKGEFVLPKTMVDQETGTPKMGGDVTINLHMDGVMARSRADLRDIGKDILGAINEELRAKNMPQLGGAR